MNEIKFIGIKWVKGYKDYNEPFNRVSSHPTIIFANEKYYYFINLTSIKEAKLRDILRNEKNIPIEVVATDVTRNQMIFKQYKMNIMVLVARVDKESVTSNIQIGFSKIEIFNNYKCSNYNKLKNELLTIIKNNINSFYVYNGNDDDYQYVELKQNDVLLPEIK